MSRATGHPSYFFPSRFTPSQAFSSRWEYPAFHWTPLFPSQIPSTPREGLPNRRPSHSNESLKRPITNPALSSSTLISVVLLDVWISKARSRVS